MGFIVEFDWASKAIMETVAIPFPTLEAATTKAVTDPQRPDLEFQTSGDIQVTIHGNGRWNRDTSYRFNAGYNCGHNKVPEMGNVGTMSEADATKLENWFLSRYPNDKPEVLKDKEPGKRNLVLVRNQCLYNFHIIVK